MNERHYLFSLAEVRDTQIIGCQLETALMQAGLIERMNDRIRITMAGLRRIGLR